MRDKIILHVCSVLGRMARAEQRLWRYLADWADAAATGFEIKAYQAAKRIDGV